MHSLSRALLPRESDQQGARAGISRRKSDIGTSRDPVLGKGSPGPEHHLNPSRSSLWMLWMLYLEPSDSRGCLWRLSHPARCCGWVKANRFLFLFLLKTFRRKAWRQGLPRSWSSPAPGLTLNLPTILSSSVALSSLSPIFPRSRLKVCSQSSKLSNSASSSLLKT